MNKKVFGGMTIAAAAIALISAGLFLSAPSAEVLREIHAPQIAPENPWDEARQAAQKDAAQHAGNPDWQVKIRTAWNEFSECPRLVEGNLTTPCSVTQGIYYLTVLKALPENAPPAGGAKR